MYQSHWRLTRKPFDSVADPQFYYPCESHQAALLKLRYALESHRGAAILAGASGLGKTLLVDILRDVLGQRFGPFVHLVFPQMRAEELLGYLADRLEGGGPGGPASEVRLTVQRIERCVAEAAESDRCPMIVVDEAHLLTDARTLEAIRLLLNFQRDGQPGLAMLLVGQPGLLPVLDRTPQLEERLVAKCLLRPFTVEETAAYVAHRLRAAGSDRAIFDDEALTALHELTQGVARRINRLADLALLVGYAEERQAVTAPLVESVAEDLVALVPE